MPMMRGSYPAIALQPPACERLAEISCPALIVEGEYEIAASHKAGQLLAETVPDARTVVIADGGHLSNADDPGAFNRAVLAFFASVAGTG
jgi:pimeloyl-ACP methyl ester carboxylesterase